MLNKISVGVLFQWPLSIPLKRKTTSGCRMPSTDFSPTHRCWTLRLWPPMVFLVLTTAAALRVAESIPLFYRRLRTRAEWTVKGEGGRENAGTADTDRKLIDALHYLMTVCRTLCLLGTNGHVTVMSPLWSQREWDFIGCSFWFYFKNLLKSDWRLFFFTYS